MVNGEWKPPEVNSQQKAGDHIALKHEERKDKRKMQENLHISKKSSTFDQLP